MKPMTYMNDSGRSVGEALRFYKLTPQDVVVLYDELDLPPAKFRMKNGGGHGGHNGLRSITAHITDATAAYALASAIRATRTVCINGFWVTLRKRIRSGLSLC